MLEANAVKFIYINCINMLYLKLCIINIQSSFTCAAFNVKQILGSNADKIVNEAVKKS